MSSTPGGSTPTPSTVVPPHAHKSPDSKNSIHEVRFVGYPKLLFIWPIILAGLIFYTFAHALNPGALETLGWVYITILGVVILAMGVDVNRNQAIFWFVAIFACWILGLYLNAVRNIPVFGWLLGWLDSIDVQYNGALGLAISIVLLVPYLIMIVYARLNDHWRITHNEFEHYSLGRMDDSLGRGAKTIRTEFPDVFEMLLGLAGTMIVYNASGTQELRRIPHVMFLPMVRQRLNKVLETVSVTDARSKEDEEEVAV
ncbi:MAG: hypothetical protein ACKVS9_17635 [Phycisphaerae bacterium]